MDWPILCIDLARSFGSPKHCTQKYAARITTADTLALTKVCGAV
jgi:hypothetical protein